MFELIFGSIILLMFSVFSFFIGIKLIKSGKKIFREDKLPEDAFQKIQELSFSYNILRSNYGDTKAIGYDRIWCGYLGLIAAGLGLIILLTFISGTLIH